ncbi:MAG TPA: hypothetical protein VGR72_07055 [Candidatus Acidoferrales bacterium]|nr:hypothetical protein [Candidatus Acidoferrales bacterium]
MIGTLCGGAIHLPQLAVTRVPDFLQLSPAVFLALPAWFSWDPLLPYVTVVLLLVLGVSMAIKKAPPQANWLDKIILCGPVFIGAPMVLFGMDHYLVPQATGRMIPAWIPAHEFWVYFVGTCLILGGLSIVFQIFAWLSAGLFGVMLLCFEALMDIPAVVARPHNLLIWSLLVREFSFSWGALSFAAMYTQAWRTKGAHWLIPIARIVLGIALVFFGVKYFLHPELLPGVPLRQQTPDFIPAHMLWGYLSSVVYVLAGACLLINRKARLVAAWTGLFVLFAVIFFCVPYMLQLGFDVQRGLNVPADTLVLSGALLCLAGSLREKLASST